MNTLVMVLSTVLGLADDGPLVWQHSYTQAEQMAAQQQKPVAVFLTQGQNSLSKLVPSGLNGQAKEILAHDYIPVMVDTSTPEGQRLARSFEIQSGQGVVLSDRGGARQAYWYQGEVSTQELVRNLLKYASQTDVQMTEVAGRTSMNPPVDEQGNSARRTRRGYVTGSDDAGDGQRRMGLRGRMSRRN